MIQLIHLIPLVPLFPVLGFLINGIFGKAVSKPVSGFIGSGTVLLSFLISAGAFLALLGLPENERSVVLPVLDWFKTGILNISISFQYDQLSALMLLIITGVGFLIHWYSTSYMKEDEGFQRYFAYLNLFIFFMLILVLASNYLVMFIGWEGVGLCSYLLVGFWFKVPAYNDAARKAFVMNRIGDLGFLLGSFLIFKEFSSFEYGTIMSGLQSPAAGVHHSPEILTAIALLLFVGAAGKSAQIPLYTWLPDAMAGPTPVSALIHAATMVTAGVYMIARSNLIYIMAENALPVIAVIGLSTALLAAAIAITQNDIKKVLAYSTVSQLGYMFLGLGAGSFGAGFFHVITHAFFKALLFLGAGSVIHAMGGEQDMRKMGGLKKRLPITFITMLMASLAISGIPPFSGFFSKDAILSQAWHLNPVFWALGVVAAMMTAYYMFRMMLVTFYGNFRGTHDQEHHLHESPLAMTIPLIVLAVLSVIGGFIGIPEAIIPDSNWLEHFLSPVFKDAMGHVPAEAVSFSTERILMIISASASVLAIGFAWKRFGAGSAPASDLEKRSFLGNLSYNKFYVDELYSLLITAPLNYMSGFLYQRVDKELIDGAVNGIAGSTGWLSVRLQKVQSGKTGNYLLLMVAGIVLLFILNAFFNPLASTH